MDKQLFEMNDDVMGGAPCFIGTRITADSLRAYWSAGYSPDATHLEYPDLSKNKIREAFKLFSTSEETSE